MTTVHHKAKIALGALAMIASFGAAATPLTLTGISGTYYVWDDTAANPNVLAPVASSLANAALALGDTGAGGNVELSKFGGPVTTLSGTAAGKTVDLSSLVLTDWTDNSNALASSYITGAAASANLTLTGAQLTTAINSFFNTSLNGYKLWQLVSDPNVSYVDVTNHTLTVGLAGLADITNILNALGITLPTGSPTPQASEVVKATFAGVTSYLYSFTGTPSGVVSVDGVSFAANYEVKAVPEPAGLALVGLGLLGLMATRRRRS